MSQDRNIERMERGKQAAVVSGAIEEVLQDYEAVTLGHMKSLYRSGKTDHDLLVGKLGELVAMDNLRAELENRQRQGDLAAMKEMGNGA